MEEQTYIWLDNYEIIRKDEGLMVGYRYNKYPRIMDEKRAQT